MLMLLKIIIRYMAILMLFSASLVTAEPRNYPKQIHLVYDVVRNGQPFATVTEDYKQVADQYHIVSNTKGLGVYALLGERKLTSDGVVTSTGLKPKHFELRQGDNAKKWLSTEFDWASNTLNMTIKGAVQAVPLMANSQDLVSYLYQFMFEPFSKNNQETLLVNVTTGKKLKPYAFNITERDQPLNTPAGDFKTTQLTSVKDAESKASDERQIWLANEQYHLPVKLIIHDDNGGEFVQTLKTIQID